MTLFLAAPAKINLFLHILGRRQDGYHEIQTFFQLLDYGDQLSFSVRCDGQLTLTPAMVDIADNDNLIIRAAKSLQATTKTRLGADIQLDKRLPLGGGLGGGSSDAATALVALNHLWKTGLTATDLANLGVQLGADVPVFVHGCSAWAEGIGEQLQAIVMPERWYLVIKPNCSVSTRQIFSHPQLTRNTPPITVASFLEKGGINDCQTTVSQIYPEVAEAISWLGQHADAQLTGTGACIFAALPSKSAADELLRKVPTHWQSFIAKGISRSPVVDLLL